jgi:hydroxypyruvate isomerase
MLKICLNISILLREYAFLDRFQAAADLGFRAVEFWYPTGIHFDEIIKAKEAAGLQVALVNADGGDLAKGDRGFLGNTAYDDHVRANFTEVLQLVDALGCSQINLLGGNAVPGMDRASQLAAAAQMQRDLCQQAVQQNVTVLVEPQNAFDNPRYMFTTTAAGLEQIRQVGAENLKLQYDVYHMQRSEGNIIDTLQHTMNHIAHIQIADSPRRNQPGTGELNYPVILAELERLGYGGYVALEYNPLNGDSIASFSWLPLEQRVTLTPAALQQ